MENPKQENAVQIGNTTFYVTSVFSGTVQLEYLIKRLIQKEIEQENNTLLYTGSSFSLWKVTKIIFLFHQNYFSRKKFCGYRFRLHVLLLKLSTVSINSLLRRVEFIDFCGWFLHASFLSDHFFRVIHMKK